MLCPQSPALTTSNSGPALLFPQRLETTGLGRALPGPEHSRGTMVSLQEHPRLLALLDSKPFRAELKADPVIALAKHGIHLDPADVPDRVTLPELPREYIAPPRPEWHALLA